ncbi:MAG: hypothetical protein QOG37_2933, partial [Mycobacterium sp.]|nr:hypothetical protein [Mycobacterium sp.]
DSHLALGGAPGGAPGTDALTK